MQPSTGAFGGIVWAYWARALNAPKSARIYANATYTQNGENDRDYQFGDETTATIGAGYQTQSPWGFNLELLYRHADRDQRNSVVIPNTGGAWLDAIPTIQYHVSETLALYPISRIRNTGPQSISKNPGVERFTRRIAVHDEIRVPTVSVVRFWRFLNPKGTLFPNTRKGTQNGRFSAQNGGFLNNNTLKNNGL